MLMDYKRIFCGIFIATFKITIGIITIFPAFVGWILVLKALSEFKENSSEKNFCRIRAGVIILVLTSFVGGIWYFFGGDGFDSILSPMLFYPLFLKVIEMVVFHKILEISVYYFKEMDHQENFDKYINKDRTYIILMGITIFLLGMSIIFNNETAGFIGAFMAIISRIYLMTVINSLSKENYNKDNKEVLE